MLPFHPLANLFPLVEGAAFEELVADVRANDVRELIVLLDGMILDGRNRYRAAQAAGLPWLAGEERLWTAPARSGAGGMRQSPHFVRYDPRNGDPLHYVLSLNLHRRHLSESQRAMVASRLATLRQGRPGEWPRPSPEAEGKPADLRDSSHVKPGAAAGETRSGAVRQADAAGLLHVSERSVQAARRVQEAAAPEVVEAVDRGQVTVSAAAELARLPVGEQLEILRTADRRAIAQLARERRRETQDAKRAHRDDREQALAARQAALPHKRYGVILADPEWRFEPRSRETGMDRAADNHYPTSPTGAIAARPVGDIAADDCVLFLWATAPMLPQALEVMAAWGFAYKSHVVWRKAEKVTGVHTWSGKGGGLILGTGYWFRNAHELLLVGTRGNVPAPAMGTQFPSMFDAPPLRHSQKPDAAYEIIERYFPSLPKVELNARSRRAGWDAWGNEVEEVEGPLTRPAADLSPEGRGEEVRDEAAVGTGPIGGRSEGTERWEEERPATRAEAEPILRTRYDGSNGAALAAELRIPIGTLRTWTFKLGLTDRGRNVARGAAMVAGFNAERGSPPPAHGREAG